MGKTYLYDCSKCGYQTKVCGGTADGINRVVQTVECADCKALYDVLVRI